MRQHLKVLTVCYVLLYSFAATAGGLETQMQKVFDGFVHHTNNQFIMSQNRGVFTGGRFTAKPPLLNMNPISLSLPSWKSGCGGIDMFNGSFSFIRGEEITQLLRSIAANSTGYAFQLALDNVFPEGAKCMEIMQKKIQLLNQQQLDSCQLAQGIVNDLTSSMHSKHKTDVSLKAMSNALYNDFFAATRGNGGTSPPQALKSSRPEVAKTLYGNLVWKQLRKNNTNTWFHGGDNVLAETMMSLTGTVIVSEEKLQHLPGNKINLRSIVDGGDLNIYSCGGDTDECAYNVGSKTVRVTGLRQKILKILGEGGNTGVINKYATNVGQLSNEEVAFLTNAPSGIGTMIRNLTLKCPETAQLYVNEISKTLALTMSYQLSTTLIDATIAAQANGDNAYKKEVLDWLRHSKESLRDEYVYLTKEYGELAAIMELYNSYIKNMPTQQYLQFEN